MIAFLITLTSLTPFTAAIFFKENKYKCLYLLIYGNYWIREVVGNFVPIYFLSQGDYIDVIRLITNCTYYIFLSALIYYALILEKKIKDNTMSVHNHQQFVVEFILSLLIALSAICLIIYVTSSTLWITNPRQAHLNLRSSIGPLYAAFLMSSTLVLFYISRLTLRFRIFGYFCLVFFAYISGSKGFILNIGLSIIAVEIIFNSAIFKYKITNSVIIFLIMNAALLLIFFQFFQGMKNETFLERLAEYFFQWYELQNTFYTYYLNDKFEIRLGELFVSSFWDFIPRFLYENKPITHGSAKLIELFFPAEYKNLGTFSFGFLSYEFADWGVFAPIVSVFYNWQMILPLFLLILFKNYMYENNYIGFLIFCIIILQGFTPYFNLFYILILTFLYWHVIKISSNLIRKIFNII